MVFVSLVKSLVKRQRTSERAEESEKRAFGKKRRQRRLHVRTARNCILVWRQIDNQASNHARLHKQQAMGQTPPRENDSNMMIGYIQTAINWSVFVGITGWGLWPHIGTTTQVFSRGLIWTLTLFRDTSGFHRFIVLFCACERARGLINTGWLLTKCACVCARARPNVSVCCVCDQ